MLTTFLDRVVSNSCRGLADMPPIPCQEMLRDSPAYAQHKACPLWLRAPQGMYNTCRDLRTARVRLRWLPRLFLEQQAERPPYSTLLTQRCGPAQNQKVN